MATRKMKAKPESKRSPLRRLLSGGDRRSIAKSNQARSLVSKGPARIAEVATLANDDDWLVSMRAFDLLDKIAHERADLVQPHKGLFIGPHADSDKWEIRLQIMRTLPLLQWTPSERARVVEILRRGVEFPQTFVRAWALDSLATVAGDDKALQAVVARALEDFERSGSKALQARAKHIRARR
jgi:HEAT repeat protein